jgi:ParB-like chromosome segregation protein Spo0J
MKLDIASIKIGKRHRLELGDIDGLAENIGSAGLLHPIVVHPDGRLMAGARRIVAVKKLGWTKIAHTKVDIEHLVFGKQAENVERKDFNKAMGLALYAAQAKDGQLVGYAIEVREKATLRLGERMEEERKAGFLREGGEPRVPKNPWLEPSPKRASARISPTPRARPQPCPKPTLRRDWRSRARRWPLPEGSGEGW